MRPLAFAAAALIAAGVEAAPAPNTHVVHEQQGAAISRGWKKLARRDQVASKPVPVRIGLKQGNMHRAHELLMDV